MPGTRMTTQWRERDIPFDGKVRRDCPGKDDHGDCPGNGDGAGMAEGADAGRIAVEDMVERQPRRLDLERQRF
jgi:hypothetical protein